MNAICEICGTEYWEIDPYNQSRLICGQECRIRWIVRDEMDKAMRKEILRPLIKAEKNTKRLADYDERVRDPVIEKAEKKSGKKLPKPPKSVK